MDEVILFVAAFTYIFILYIICEFLEKRNAAKLKAKAEKEQEEREKEELRKIHNRLCKLKIEISSLEKYLFLLDEFISIDVETTGLKAAKSSIIQIGCVYFKNGKATRKYIKYINPECSIPYNATKVNNITNSMVEGAPTFDELLRVISKIVTNYKIVGHNLRFDVKMIEEEFKRRNVNVNVNWGFCTMSEELKKPILESKPTKYIKLLSLANKLKIPVEGRLHDAYTDALLAGRIAVNLAIKKKMEILRLEKENDFLKKRYKELNDKHRMFIDRN
ncbi:3'-5' exonuclease [Escherichia coli]|uniref:3'-5' exonuclease n=2 Tax=Escherichia TaxID=561 RepID=UPI00259CC794|nr:3'-5' exonuclease [Escherichia coli]MDM4936517.1 3'-5' exonuclease [Escherichia coli]MDM4941605.1 3'-5' exonuclease [Escherichia coli]HCP5787693.1 3'-5' exonuclease [Escherichia coli]HCP5797678.1 3'-5' exonuclease [Escherichia coli]HCP5807672.1 3'-5' exonuclease [Escherichia coli]